MGPAEIVEIRVHGIGNKELLDALGRPRFERLNPASEVTTAPALPDHKVRIINWARSNKEFTRGFFWYVAHPFTLANVIGYMRPPRGSSRFFALVAFTGGLLLTAAQVAWAAVIAETVFSFTPIAIADKSVGGAIPLVVSAALAVVMLYRASEIRHANDVRDPGPKLPVLAANVISAVVTGSFLSGRYLPGWLDGLGLDPAFRLNPMLVVVVASTLAAYSLAGIILLLYMGVGRKEIASDGAPAEADGLRARIRFSSMRRQYAAAALALIVSMVMMHALGSLLRIAASDLMWLLRALAFPGMPVELQKDAVTLLVSADDTGTFKDNLLDMVPVYCLGVLAILGLSWEIAARERFGPDERWPRPLKLRAELQRSAVHRLGELLPKVTAGFMGGSLVFLSVAGFLTARAGEGSRALEFLIGSSHGLSYVVLLATVVGQFPEITSKTRLIADVVGFWPIRNHPLAGVSYRRRVVAGIRLEMGRYPQHTVVLVGHSQGSVICAWLIRAGLLPIDENRVHLITCGCPLMTLYSTLFPAFYTLEDFRATRRNVASWTNFWRSTDAISSKVPCAVNREIPEPGPDGLIEKHGNYWTSSLLADQVSRIESATRSPKPGTVTEQTPQRTTDVTILRQA